MSSEMNFNKDFAITVSTNLTQVISEIDRAMTAINALEAKIGNSAVKMQASLSSVANLQFRAPVISAGGGGFAQPVSYGTAATGGAASSYAGMTGASAIHLVNKASLAMLSSNKPGAPKYALNQEELSRKLNQMGRDVEAMYAGAVQKMHENATQAASLRNSVVKISSGFAKNFDKEALFTQTLARELGNKAGTGLKSVPAIGTSDRINKIMNLLASTTGGLQGSQLNSYLAYVKDQRVIGKLIANQLSKKQLSDVNDVANLLRNSGINSQLGLVDNGTESQFLAQAVAVAKRAMTYASSGGLKPTRERLQNTYSQFLKPIQNIPGKEIPFTVGIPIDYSKVQRLDWGSNLNQSSINVSAITRAAMFSEKPHAYKQELGSYLNGRLAQKLSNMPTGDYSQAEETIAYQRDLRTKREEVIKKRLANRAWFRSQVGYEPPIGQEDEYLKKYQDVFNNQRMLGGEQRILNATWKTIPKNPRSGSGEAGEVARRAFGGLIHESGMLAGTTLTEETVMPYVLQQVKAASKGGKKVSQVMLQNVGKKLISSIAAFREVSEALPGFALDAADFIKFSEQFGQIDLSKAKSKGFNVGTVRAEQNLNRRLSGFLFSDKNRLSRITAMAPTLDGGDASINLAISANRSRLEELDKMSNIDIKSERAKELYTKFIKSPSSMTSDESLELMYHARAVEDGGNEQARHWKSYYESSIRARGVEAHRNFKQLSNPAASQEMGRAYLKAQAPSATDLDKGNFSELITRRLLGKSGEGIFRDFGKEAEAMLFGGTIGNKTFDSLHNMTGITAANIDDPNQKDNLIAMTKKLSSRMSALKIAASYARLYSPYDKQGALRRILQGYEEGQVDPQQFSNLGLFKDVNIDHRLENTPQGKSINQYKRWAAAGLSEKSIRGMAELANRGAGAVHEPMNLMMENLRKLNLTDPSGETARNFITERMSRVIDPETMAQLHGVGAGAFEGNAAVGKLIGGNISFSDEKTHILLAEIKSLLGTGAAAGKYSTVPMEGAGGFTRGKIKINSARQAVNYLKTLSAEERKGTLAFLENELIPAADKGITALPGVPGMSPEQVGAYAPKAEALQRLTRGDAASLVAFMKQEEPGIVYGHNKAILQDINDIKKYGGKAPISSAQKKLGAQMFADTNKQLALELKIAEQRVAQERKGDWMMQGYKDSTRLQQERDVPIYLRYDKQKKAEKRAESTEVSGTIDNAFKRALIWGGVSTAIYKTVGAGAQFIQTIIKMDKQLLDFQKTLFLSEEGMNKLADGAFDVARTLKVPTQTIMDAIEMFSAQYKNPDDLLKLGGAAGLFSNISGQGIKESVETITAAMQQYEMAVSSVGKITDSWAGLSATASVSIKDLGDAVGNAGGAARSAGVSFDELSAMTAVIVSSTGQSGKGAGTALTRMFERATTRENAGELYKKHGISTFDQAGKMRPFTHVLADIAEKWDGISDSEKKSIAVSIAGARQYSTFIALMNNYDKYLKDVTVSETSRGTAALQNQMLNQSLEKGLVGLGVEYENLARGAKDAVIPALQGITVAMTGVLKTFNDAPGVIKAFMASMAAVGALGIGGGQLLKILGTTTNTGGQHVSTFNKQSAAGAFMNSAINPTTGSVSFFGTMGKIAQNASKGQNLAGDTVGRGGVLSALGGGLKAGFTGLGAITGLGSLVPTAGGASALMASMTTAAIGLASFAAVIAGLVAVGWLFYKAWDMARDKTDEYTTNLIKGQRDTLNKIATVNQAESRVSGALEEFSSIANSTDTSDQKKRKRAELRDKISSELVDIQTKTPGILGRTSIGNLDANGKILVDDDALVRGLKELQMELKNTASAIAEGGSQKSKEDFRIAMEEYAKQRVPGFENALPEDIGGVDRATFGQDQVKVLRAATIATSKLAARQILPGSEGYSKEFQKEILASIPEGGVNFATLARKAGFAERGNMNYAALEKLGASTYLFKDQIEKNLTVNAKNSKGEMVDMTLGEMIASKEFKEEFKLNEIDKDPKKQAAKKNAALEAIMLRSRDAFNAYLISTGMEDKVGDLAWQRQFYNDVYGAKPTGSSTRGPAPFSEGRSRANKFYVPRIDLELNKSLESNTRMYNTIGGADHSYINGVVTALRVAIENTLTNPSMAMGPIEHAAMKQLDTELFKERAAATKLGSDGIELDKNGRPTGRTGQTIIDHIDSIEKDKQAIVKMTTERLDGLNRVLKAEYEYARKIQDITSNLGSAMNSFFSNFSNNSLNAAKVAGQTTEMGLTGKGTLQVDQNYDRAMYGQLEARQRQAGYYNTARGRNERLAARESIDARQRQIDEAKNSASLGGLASAFAGDLGKNALNTATADFTKNTTEGLGKFLLGEPGKNMFGESNPVKDNTAALKELTATLRGEKPVTSQGAIAALAGRADSGSIADAISRAQVSNGMMGPVGVAGPAIIGGAAAGLNGLSDENDTAWLDNYAQNTSAVDARSNNGSFSLTTNQKAALGGALAGGMAGYGMTQARGRTGMGGAVGGAIGGALGSTVGAAYGGAYWGPLVGSLIGTMFDKPIDTNDKQIPELEDAITMELKTISKNINTVNDTMENIINGPANFVLPIPRGILENSVTAQSALASPFQAGGIITKSGPAFLHAGETVVPSHMVGRAGGNQVTNTININGANKDPQEIANEVMMRLNANIYNESSRAGNYRGRF